MLFYAETGNKTLKFGEIRKSAKMIQKLLWGPGGFEPLTLSVGHFPYLKRDFQDQFSHRARSSTWIMTVLRGAPEPLLLRGKGPIFTILY